MTKEFDKEIFGRVEASFVRVFGEQYAGKLSVESSMDDFVEWDSLNYIDFVCELEDEFGIEFSETESAQMFQIQHILRIINSIVHHQPHDDVKHAYAQMRLIEQYSNDDCLQIAILSGSSTREGFLPLSQMQALAESEFEEKIRIYNISVSGLVIAEMLQIVESLEHIQNLRLVIGFSPIILFGCGMNEFNRSCDLERFSLPCPSTSLILKQNGFIKNSDIVVTTIEGWCNRYLADLSLEELRYTPYKYPTLQPWDEEKFSDEDAILRYYNNAPLNFSQSYEINVQLLKVLVDKVATKQNKLVLLNLTLHSKTESFLEDLGELVSKTKNYIDTKIKDGSVILVDSVKSSGITDNDYRDPGHIFKKQDLYTKETINRLNEIFSEEKS